MNELKLVVGRVTRGRGYGTGRQRGGEYHGVIKVCRRRGLIPVVNKVIVEETEPVGKGR